MMNFSKSLTDCLRRVRGINFQLDSQSSPFDAISAASTELRVSAYPREAEALQRASSKCRQDEAYGGLGYSGKSDLTESEQQEILFQVEAYLEAVNSREKTRRLREPLKARHPQSKPMNLAQKIFAHHAINGCATEGLQLGDVARVSVDWIMASELSYRVSK